jgi:hypothetical protein
MKAFSHGTGDVTRIAYPASTRRGLPEVTGLLIEYGRRKPRTLWFAHLYDGLTVVLVNTKTIRITGTVSIWKGLKQIVFRCYRVTLVRSEDEDDDLVFALYEQREFPESWFAHTIHGDHSTLNMKGN